MYKKVQVHGSNLLTLTKKKKLSKNVRAFLKKKNGNFVCKPRVGKVRWEKSRQEAGFLSRHEPEEIEQN